MCLSSVLADLRRGCDTNALLVGVLSDAYTALSDEQISTIAGETNQIILQQIIDQDYSMDLNKIKEEIEDRLQFTSTQLDYAFHMPRFLNSFMETIHVCIILVREAKQDNAYELLSKTMQRICAHITNLTRNYGDDATAVYASPEILRMEMEDLKDHQKERLRAQCRQISAQPTGAVQRILEQWSSTGLSIGKSLSDEYDSLTKMQSKIKINKEVVGNGNYERSEATSSLEPSNTTALQQARELFNTVANSILTKRFLSLCLIVTLVFWTFASVSLWLSQKWGFWGIDMDWLLNWSSTRTPMPQEAAHLGNFEEVWRRYNASASIVLDKNATFDENVFTNMLGLLDSFNVVLWIVSHHIRKLTEGVESVVVSYLEPTTSTDLQTIEQSGFFIVHSIVIKLVRTANGVLRYTVPEKIVELAVRQNLIDPLRNVLRVPLKQTSEFDDLYVQKEALRICQMLLDPTEHQQITPEYLHRTFNDRMIGFSEEPTNPSDPLWRQITQLPTNNRLKATHAITGHLASLHDAIQAVQTVETWSRGRVRIENLSPNWFQNKLPDWITQTDLNRVTEKLNSANQTNVPITRLVKDESIARQRMWSQVMLFAFFEEWLGKLQQLAESPSGDEMSVSLPWGNELVTVTSFPRINDIDREALAFLQQIFTKLRQRELLSMYDTIKSFEESSKKYIKDIQEIGEVLRKQGVNNEEEGAFYLLESDLFKVRQLNSANKTSLFLGMFKTCVAEQTMVARVVNSHRAELAQKSEEVRRAFEVTENNTLEYTAALCRVRTNLRMLCGSSKKMLRLQSLPQPTYSSSITSKHTDHRICK